jgi:hypothetical protein
MNVFKFGIFPNGPYLYPDLTMNDIDICYGPTKFNRLPGLGLRILVPADMFMVIVLANGKRIVLDEGYQYRPEIPVGRYQAYFVAKCQGNLLLTIETLTADAINIKVGVTLGWEIVNPRRITRVSSPVQQFTDLSEAAISEVFSRYKYEQIVGTIENSTLNLSEISRKIWEEISALQHQCGIAATRLKIRSSCGDSTLLDQAKDYLKANLNRKVIDVNGEIKTSEESYSALVASIRQKSLALEDARNNLAQEPQRLQERILNAMHEIGRVITNQANMDASSVPGFQPYSYKLDPAYAKAIEVAVTALRDLAISSTLPKEMHETIHPILKSTETSLKGNEHKRSQSSSLLPSRPPKDHTRQKMGNEPLAG